MPVVQFDEMFNNNQQTQENEQTQENDKDFFFKKLIPAIAYTKDKIPFDELPEYNSWLVNRTISFNMATIRQANQANLLSGFGASGEFQYEFLLNVIPPKKRFFRWTKKIKTIEVEAIMNLYQCNEAKAKEIQSILTEENVKRITKIYKSLKEQQEFHFL